MIFWRVSYSRQKIKTRENAGSSLMMHSIVADESVDFRVVKQLRQYGFDVYAICEMQPSINDRQVLDIATEKDAILISAHYADLYGKFSVLSERKLRIKE